MDPTAGVCLGPYGGPKGARLFLMGQVPLLTPQPHQDARCKRPELLRHPQALKAQALPAPPSPNP